MEINLNKELASYVEESIKSGQYSSASEVVATALKVMQEVQELETMANEDLRRAVAEGLAQLERGEGEPWDVEKTKAKFLAEWSRQKRAG
jgi:putative addiction module CopG family antidote